MSLEKFIENIRKCKKEGKPKIDNVELTKCWDEWEREDPNFGKIGNKGGFTLSWGGYIGCGQFSFIMENDGSVTCDNECMDRETVREALLKFLESVELRDKG